LGLALLCVRTHLTTNIERVPHQGDTDSPLAERYHIFTLVRHLPPIHHWRKWNPPPTKVVRAARPISERMVCLRVCLCAAWRKLRCIGDNHLRERELKVVTVSKRFDMKQKILDMKMRLMEVEQDPA